LKIAFLCPTISRTSGGIFEIERKLALELARMPETDLDVFGSQDEHTQSDFPLWAPLRPVHFAYLGPTYFRFSSQLQEAFLAEDADIAHLHALWMHNSITIRKWAQKWHRPYIITANGMLEEWAVRNSGWKKRLALTLYEQKCLNNAACIQVNSESEYRSVRAFGLTNPVCVIPNGIDLPEQPVEPLPNDVQTFWNRQIPPGNKILLYLGRLHPKKGLVNLLRAWTQARSSQTNSDGWVLVIAGWDQVNHLSELQKVVAKSGISKVVFAGPQFGAEKSLCFRNSDAFILPSYSEGLPMTILEAWSYGKPVLMTPGCNLPIGFSSDAALRIEPTVESIESGLTALFKMSDRERDVMGRRGIDLVKTHFAWPQVAADMRAVYSWILGNGVKPRCVLN
jgi:poly(glycerol-phosphate) alpha-glucosyltransferase